MVAGRKAEEIILTWLAAQPWIVGVEDLRPFRPLREADVDCSLALSDGRVTLAELKSDRHLGRSGKYLFEVLRLNHTAPSDRAVTLGWSARSPARWLLFYAPYKHEIHQILMDEYRNAVQTYTGEVRGRTEFSYVPTDRIKSTVNILVPSKYVTGKPSYRLHALPQSADEVGR